MANSFIDIAAGQSASSESDVTIAKTSVADTIAGDNTTDQTVSVGGSNTGYLNSGTDLDWFAVDLVAGQRYSFTTAANGGSPTDDTVLTLFDSGNSAVAYNDDNATPGDFFSEILYTAATTGTYYIQVAPFDNTSVGGYQISAAIAPPAVSVLPTLDWGTQITPTNNVINVYFANNGETFDGQTSVGWGATEEDAAMAAFDQFSNYINVTFNVVNTAAASDIQMVQVASLSSLGSGTLGYFNPPGTTNEGVGVFAQDGRGWDAAGLAQGGYGFITLIHEIGHGLGLAHPHDTGGSSTVMAGVTQSQGDYGDFNLNQGVFTMMSYNDGWPIGPNSGVPTNDGYGWAGTAMALDVAVLQDKYGANTANESGNSSYALSANNAAGTFYSSIWDTGGIDTISFSGSADATIDLREASLLEETNGGGYVSFVAGVHGGYTIANGAVIENATGGNGSDDLIGNDVDNTLLGNGGDDTLVGGLGNDTAIYSGNRSDYNITAGVAIAGSFIITDTRAGQDGVDTVVTVENFQFADGTVTAANLLNPYNVITGTNSDETLVGTAGADEINGLGGADVLLGVAGDDILNGSYGNDGLYGGDGNDILNGGLGNDLLNGQDGDDTLNGGDNGDQLFGHIGNDTLNGDGASDILKGHTGDDILNGGDAADFMFGEDDNDTLNGGTGNDVLLGGNGNDILNGNEDDDTIFGQSGIDTLNGGTGNDKLYAGSENDTVHGGDGDDLVFGQDGDDQLFGDLGSDTIAGGTGLDTLDGGAGDDFLYGQVGDDSLLGGAGNDLLSGGAGVDTFVFGDGFGIDTITDFANDGLEKINLTNVTGITDYANLGNNVSANAAGDVVITDGLDTITITNYSLADMDANDFIF